MSDMIEKLKGLLQAYGDRKSKTHPKPLSFEARAAPFGGRDPGRERQPDAGIGILAVGVIPSRGLVTSGLELIHTGLEHRADHGAQDVAAGAALPLRLERQRLGMRLRLTVAIGLQQAFEFFDHI